MRGAPRLSYINGAGVFKIVPFDERGWPVCSENLIHRIFDAARLYIEIKDRFGNPVIPREWFLVPLFVVNEAVDRIKDGTITDFRYDPKAAALVRVGKT